MKKAKDYPIVVYKITRHKYERHSQNNFPMIGVASGKGEKCSPKGDVRDNIFLMHRVVDI